MIIILGPMKKRLEKVPPGLRVKKLGKDVSRVLFAINVIKLENLGCNGFPHSVIRQCIVSLLQGIIWDSTLLITARLSPNMMLGPSIGTPNILNMYLISTTLSTPILAATNSDP